MPELPALARYLHIHFPKTGPIGPDRKEKDVLGWTATLLALALVAGFFFGLVGMAASTTGMAPLGLLVLALVIAALAEIGQLRPPL